MTQREKLAQDVVTFAKSRAQSIFGVMFVSAEAVADWILAERAKREGLLVEALDKIRLYRFHHTFIGQVDCANADVAADALRAHAALDAPPKRTLREVAWDLAGQGANLYGAWHVVVSKDTLDELRDALERADASDAPKGVEREGAK